MSRPPWRRHRTDKDWPGVPASRAAPGHGGPNHRAIQDEAQGAEEAPATWTVIPLVPGASARKMFIGVALSEERPGCGDQQEVLLAEGTQSPLDSSSDLFIGTQRLAMCPRKCCPLEDIPKRTCSPGDFDLCHSQIFTFISLPDSNLTVP